MDVVNRGPSPREVLCSTYFYDDTTLQYGRRLWLPAQSVLRTEHPILLPKFDRSQGQYSLSVRWVLDASSPRETLIKGRGADCGMTAR